MIETVPVAAWVYQQLQSVGLTVYDDPAPPDAVTPFVVFSILPGADTIYTGATRAIESSEVVVRVIGAGGSREPLKVYADAVDTALHGKANSPGDGITVLSCAREYPLDYATVEAGVKYRHLGGRYRLITT